jgi:hypothetical protein
MICDGSHFNTSTSHSSLSEIGYAIAGPSANALVVGFCFNREMYLNRRVEHVNFHGHRGTQLMVGFAVSSRCL